MKLSIHSRQEQRRQIVAQHRAAHTRAEIVRGKTGKIVPVFDLYKALRALDNRIDRFENRRSKYRPHQGKQECERRRRNK